MENMEKQIEFTENEITILSWALEDTDIFTQQAKLPIFKKLKKLGDLWKERRK